MAQLVENPPVNAGDTRVMGSISGSGIFPREGNGNPIQYSCLENSADRSLADYSPRDCRVGNNSACAHAVHGPEELGITEHVRTRMPAVVPGPAASALAGRALEVQTGTPWWFSG